MVRDTGMLHANNPSICCDAHTAHQHDHAFIPKHLGQWEISKHTHQQPLSMPPRAGCTTCVATNDGHLLGPTRPKSAFVLNQTTPISRWPQHPLHRHSGAATMGYKGIPTHYLRRCTWPQQPVKITEWGKPKSTQK